MKSGGSPDGRQALDGIRGKLDRLGRPRFRLSCREADWFGANDRERLKAASRNRQVAVLRLDRLTGEDILKILHNNLKVDEPEKFVGEAHRKGLEPLLKNPQSLSMLVKAVGGAGDDWPETRLQTFDMACRTLLREHRQEHQVAKPDNVGISVLLDAAGRLCTVQLLAGCAGYTLPGTESDHEYPSLEQISGRDQKFFDMCWAPNCSNLQVKVVQPRFTAMWPSSWGAVSCRIGRKRLAGWAYSGLDDG